MSFQCNTFQTASKDFIIFAIKTKPNIKENKTTNETTNQIAQTRARTRMDLDCVTGYQVQYDNAPTLYA